MSVGIPRAWSAGVCLRASSVALCLCLLACRGPAKPETPEQAVRTLIDRLQRVHGDPERSLEAYEMLAQASRDNLAQRAQRASDTLGRPVEPPEMLAPSRFFLEFEPERWETQTSGQWAVVVVHGAGAEQRREVRCVKEEGEWKVLLEFPPLPPVESRGQ